MTTDIATIIAIIRDVILIIAVSLICIVLIITSLKLNRIIDSLKRTTGRVEDIADFVSNPASGGKSILSGLMKAGSYILGASNKKDQQE
tara:strand:- start:171 stop:437 length:267 start_codon:yes stop_codon:yes gene_type:complete